MTTPTGRTIRRLPVPLTERDEADLALIRSSPEAQRAIGATEGMSDAALVHALVAYAASRAREVAEEAAYAALATDPEHQEFEAALRRRGRRRSQPEGVE